MKTTPTYPKRLIEVDLPIRRISEQGRRDRNARDGHISSLHIWWARRPLAVCRAVICAALWPDPADPHCPVKFVEKAREEMLAWTTHDRQQLLSLESQERFEKARLNPTLFEDTQELQSALLDFIADFANWDNSTISKFLNTSRELTECAHESLGGSASSRPLVVDPFAGGGAIPVEALRVGAESFASDLNPVAVLLNKLVLEYIPKHGSRLAAEVGKWGEWIKQEVQTEIGKFYPADPDGASPIAYLWARTIRCEGPACGTEIPLLNQLIVSRRRRVGVALSVKGRKITLNIYQYKKEPGQGTVQNGKVVCPRCHHAMSSARYRERARDGQLGELIYCVVLSTSGTDRRYRTATGRDRSAFKRASQLLSIISADLASTGDLNPIPTEMLSEAEPRRLNVRAYGFTIWAHLFNRRQLLALTVFSLVLRRAHSKLLESEPPDFAKAVTTALALVQSNITQYNSSVSTWLSDGMISTFIQSSSIPMRSDYAEANPLMSRLVGGYDFQLARTVRVIEKLGESLRTTGSAIQRSATVETFPAGSVDAFVTDPPYYFAIPYAELSDFFYVWLRRMLIGVHPELFETDTTPKKLEAIQNLAHSGGIDQKDRQHFEERIYESLAVARTELREDGLAVVVFAHASTEGWESLLKSLLRAGWMITASWPIDTEREGRMLASRQRSLASSIHLVCRARSHSPGVDESQVGGWADVLTELPGRVHHWMTRLAREQVVGADAIFACIGPALEIFSRYSRVERASGEEVSLKEYLEKVWEAVAKEALSMIFEGADTLGFEEDARLTAIWLWTLSTAKGQDDVGSRVTVALNPEEDDESLKGKKKLRGYALEYDAARKLAQGLGAHLEEALQDSVWVDTRRVPLG